MAPNDGNAPTTDSLIGNKIAQQTKRRFVRAKIDAGATKSPQFRQNLLKVQRPGDDAITASGHEPGVAGFMAYSGRQFSWQMPPALQDSLDHAPR